MGAHISIAGGVHLAVERAADLGATAFQIFLKNNNQWRGKPIDPDHARLFREGVAAGGFAPPVAHSAYLINLASPDPVTSSRSIEAMHDELERARQLGVPGVVLHPGAHIGRGEAWGISTIASRINNLLERTAGNPAGIWIETTAGTGTWLGWRFEQLAEIVERIEDPTRIGVCLDTCHIFTAGYDIRTSKGVKATLKEFDRIVGLKRLRAIHVNDSKMPLGSHRDRHEHIGRGEIGREGFAALLQDRRLRKIPFILETPKGPDSADDRRNLAFLRRLAQKRK